MFSSITLLLIGAVLLVVVLGAVFVWQSFRTLRATLLYAFGIYEFARSLQVLSAQIVTGGLVGQERILAQYPSWSGEALLNRHVHVSDLSDHESRIVTAPNNDTLYTSAVLELSQGPVEVRVPDSPSRYLSVAFMDMFNDQVAYIGTRATEGRGGVYWIIGPEQEVEVPPGVIRFDMAVNDLWMLARVFVAGENDLDAARKTQSQIQVQPVDEHNKGRLFTTKATSNSDPDNFLTVVNEALGRSPLRGHSLRASRFASFGICPGERHALQKLSMFHRALWQIVAPKMESRISAGVRSLQEQKSGWMTPPLILGNYGENDEVRAGVALVGFGALTVEEAMYFRAMTDDKGQPLDGHKQYRMHIPAEGIPTGAFWSLSMYQESEGSHRVYFYPNEIGRYAINSASLHLVSQPDGSIILALQPEPPSDPTLVWMPTPKGPFQTIFRAYLPLPEMQKGDWTVPPLEPVM